MDISLESLEEAVSIWRKTHTAAKNNADNSKDTAVEMSEQCRLRVLGNGKWVEVDNNGNVVNSSGVNPVDKSSGDALRAPQSNTFTGHFRSSGGP